MRACHKLHGGDVDAGAGTCGECENLKTRRGWKSVEQRRSVPRVQGRQDKTRQGGGTGRAPAWRAARAGASPCLSALRGWPHPCECACPSTPRQVGAKCAGTPTKPTKAPHPNSAKPNPTVPNPSPWENTVIGTSERTHALPTRCTGERPSKPAATDLL